MAAKKKVCGYVGEKNGRVVLVAGDGKKVLGTGHKIGCTRIKPGQPGSWISSERCSYRFLVNGKWYSGRGYGEGMSFCGREMKKLPRGR